MEYVIRSEDDAFEYLQKIIDHGIDLEKDTIRFDGWPYLNLYIKGSKFDSSLTPSLMKGFLELQKGINRSYCLVKYGTPNTNVLTKSEREELEIKVKVEGGSTTTGVDLQALLTNIGTKVIDKMDPTTLAITLVSLGLIWVGKTSYASYLENRRQIRENEVKSEETREMLKSQQFMSEQETERTRLLTQVMLSNNAINNVSKVAEDTKAALIKELGTTASSTIQGISVDGEMAAELAKNARRKSIDVAFNARFRILTVDSTDPETFKVRLRNIETKEEFNAKVQDYSLDSKYIKALQYGEWSKTPINLVVSAKSKDNEISHATVLEARVPEPDEQD
ncbi:hypothetical protein F0M03_04635 [Vibrio parahaemolyticus]|uniref:hypothetical protein n=1 Tax=Vibrio parahaemolyticus TaxID=670 RepID=UPI001299F34E|nr:hypothetical protein [Vibrio parahaemolyticus]MBM4916949.1 hypothetical protein [Vibrio parahaemolyticus]MCX8922538.1 hypothetical protein [Vibrio parahaemolyticus]MRE02423.1 hypothetical protein [Vibrio parahaemolyticus]HCG8184416.1 hypothetical protein [Vibrio parahaemolyticus]